MFQRFQDGEVISDQELEIQRADGGTPWVSLSVRPLHDAHGRLIESRSMIVDITRRKLAEKDFSRGGELIDTRPLAAPSLRGVSSS